MNLQRTAKSVIANLPTTADIDLAGHTGEAWIKGLIPFKRADLVSITRVLAAAEVQQVITIGATTVVSANQAYQFIAGNTLDKNFEYNNRQKPYTAVAPAILGINVQTDRYNLQTRLASRVNNDVGCNMFAGAAVQIAFAPTTVAPVTPGNNRPVWVKGSLSGCVAFIYFNAVGVPSIGNGAITTAILNVYNGILPITNDVFTATNSPIDGSLGTLTANFPVVTATPVTTALGLGLVLVDKAGYYNAKGTRHGITSVNSTKGFVGTDIVVTVVGAVSSGQGPRLAQNVPVKEVSSDNLASGDWDFPSASNNPISDVVDQSKVSDLTSSNAGGYDIIQIVAKKKVSANTSHGTNVESNYIRMNIYAVNNAAGYAAWYTKLGTI